MVQVLTDLSIFGLNNDFNMAVPIDFMNSSGGLNDMIVQPASVFYEHGELE